MSKRQDIVMWIAPSPTIPRADRAISAIFDHADNDHETTVEDVTVLEKQAERIACLGLTPAKAKQLLTQLQQRLLAQQVAAFQARHSCCDTCGAPLRTKGQYPRTFRTLISTVTLPSPRMYHCSCQHSPTTTFRPLTALLTKPTAPELVFMESEWASLVS